MLYRLDYLNDDGSTGEAVRDYVMGGDYICRHMTTARKTALARALGDERPVLVSRIGKAGAMRPCLVIQPDGRATRPGGMDGEYCTRDGLEGRTCFCRNCRASRRAAR